MFQQHALMNSAQGAYMNPVTLNNGQINQVNGLSNGSVTPTSGKIFLFAWNTLIHKFITIIFSSSQH